MISAYNEADNIGPCLSSVLTSDPASEVSFAAGPFMLFRRSAYEAIGGHRALAAAGPASLAVPAL